MTKTENIRTETCFVANTDLAIVMYHHALVGRRGTAVRQKGLRLQKLGMSIDAGYHTPEIHLKCFPKLSRKFWAGAGRGLVVSKVPR